MTRKSRQEIIKAEHKKRNSKNNDKKKKRGPSAGNKDVVAEEEGNSPSRKKIRNVMQESSGPSDDLSSEEMNLVELREKTKGSGRPRKKPKQSGRPKNDVNQNKDDQEKSAQNEIAEMTFDPIYPVPPEYFTARFNLYQHVFEHGLQADDLYALLSFYVECAFRTQKLHVGVVDPAYIHAVQKDFHTTYEAAMFVKNINYYGCENPDIAFIPLVVPENDISLHATPQHWSLGVWFVKQGLIHYFDPILPYASETTKKLLFKLVDLCQQDLNPNNVLLRRVHSKGTRTYDKRKDDIGSEFYIAFYAELHLTKTSYSTKSYEKKNQNYPTKLAVRHFNSIGYKLRSIKFLQFLQRGVWPDYGSGLIQQSFPFTNSNPPLPLPVDASLRRSVRIDKKRKESEALVSNLHTVVNAKTTKIGGQLIQHNIFIKKLPPLTAITPQCHSRTHPGKCAASSVNHRVDYYHSGSFGMLIKDDAMVTKKLCQCKDSNKCECKYKCRYCAADLLRSEYAQHLKGTFMKCCGNGRYITLEKEYQERQKTPFELKEFTHGPKKFMKDIISYNTELSFASITTEEGDKPRMPPGRLAPVLLNGCSSYQIGSMYPPTDERGVPQKPLFAQVYIVDPSHREATRAWLNKDVLKTLDQMLRACDPFCSLYKQAHEIYSEQFAAYQKELLKRSANSQEKLKAPRLRMIILTNREVQAVGALEPGQHLHKTEHPEVPNIGLIWVDNEGEPPIYKGAWVMDKEGKTKQMPYLDPQIDPLCFPLICPYGQMGYRYGIRIPKLEEDKDSLLENEAKKEDIRDNSESDYSQASGDDDSIGQLDPAESRRRFDDADMCIQSDPDVANIPRHKIKKRSFISYRQWIRYMMMFRKANDIQGDNYHHIWSKGKLAEAYILHCSTRIERHEIDEVKKAQKKYRKILRGKLPEVLEKRLHKKHPGAKLGKIFLDPVTVKGSRRYMQRAYADAMSIIMKTGNPFRFVTFTGNPYWPEITEIIKDKNLTWLNRVDAVCRVFTDKAEEFIKDLTERHVLGKLSGYVFSLEHQKRGMPHLHCLLIPDPENDLLGTVNFLEDFISARIPHNTDEDSEQGEQQRTLRQLVIKHNLHSCSEDSMCLFGGKCIKRFPKTYSRTTTLAENMFPIYRRLPPMPEDGDTICTPAKITEPQLEPEKEDNPVTANYEDEECDNVSILSCHSDVPSVDSADADVEDRDQPTKRYNPAPIPEEAMPHDFDCTEYGSKHEAVQKNGVARVFDDRHVVPYNAFLTLKYRTHINVEDCWGQKCVNYVLKYITKGHDLAYVKVTPSDTAPDEYDYDETRVRLVRYMTASEAFMKLWSYPIVQLSHTVEKLFVHDTDGPGLLYEEGYEDELLENPKDVVHDKSKLLGFFKLNQDILANPHKHPAEYRGKGLMYTEVNKFYAYDKQSGRWRLRKTGLSDKSKASRLSRLCSVNSADAQLTAIRLLLINVCGPRNFEDLKRVNELHPDRVDYNLAVPNCDSFVAACRARGLLEDNKMWKQTLLEARCEFTSDLRLIHFFAMLILHSNPPDVANCFEYLLSLMTPPGSTAYQMEQKRQMILNRLEWLFTANEKSCKLLGLPSPANYNPAQLEEEMDDETYQAFVTADRDPIRATRWDSYAQKNIKLMDANTEQKEAFKRLSSAISSNLAEDVKQQCFFLGGSGGTGKTFLYNTIIAWCKSQSIEVAVTASTGIAATLLIGGTTLHSSFRIPLDLSKSKTPKIDYNSETAEKIRRTKVIIIDEVSCLHKMVLEYLDEVIREVSPRDQRQKPFGGKVIILGGDWKQLMPIVKRGMPGYVNGGILDQFAATIKQSDLWKHFDNGQLLLVKNMRIREDKDKKEVFANQLLMTGTGTNYFGRTPYVLANKNQLVGSLTELLQIYPEAALQNPKSEESLKVFAKTAILCPKNVDVYNINNIIVNQMNGEKRTYVGIDHVISEEGTDLFALDYCNRLPENINKMTPPGMPPHRLDLKEGAVVMLIKNLDIKNGLVNGTRLQLLKLGEQVLTCRVLTGPQCGQTVCIPKVRFEYGNSPGELGVRWSRLMYPVRVSFAISVNKAQGQTLENVGICLEHQEVFSHGHLYVAMSRAQTADGIKILNHPVHRDDGRVVHNLIKNIVLQRVLDHRDRQKGIELARKDFIPILPEPIPSSLQKNALTYKDDEWRGSNTTWFCYGRDRFSRRMPMTKKHLQCIEPYLKSIGIKDILVYPVIIPNYDHLDYVDWGLWRVNKKLRLTDLHCDALGVDPMTYENDLKEGDDYSEGSLISSRSDMNDNVSLLKVPSLFSEEIHKEKPPSLQEDLSPPKVDKNETICPYPTLLLQNPNVDCCLNSALQSLRMLTDIKQALTNIDDIRHYFTHLPLSEQLNSQDAIQIHEYIENIGRLLKREGEPYPLPSGALRNLRGFPFGPEQQDAEEILTHIIRSYPPLKNSFAFNQIQTLVSSCKCVQNRQRIDQELTVQMPVSSGLMDFSVRLNELCAEEHFDYVCDRIDHRKDGTTGGWNTLSFDLSSTNHLLIKLNVFINVPIRMPDGKMVTHIKRLNPFITGLKTDRQSIFGRDFRLQAIIWRSGETVNDGHYKVIARSETHDDFYIFEDALKPKLCQNYFENGMENAYILIFSKIDSLTLQDSLKSSNVPNTLTQVRSYSKPVDMPRLPPELSVDDVSAYIQKFCGERIGNNCVINGYQGRLYRSDLLRLTDSTGSTNAWLNDNLLDCYMDFLTSEFSGFGNIGYFHPQMYLRRKEAYAIRTVNRQSWQWNETQTVFAVGRIHGNHFVLVVANLLETSIQVLDSLFAVRADPEAVEFGKVIGDMLSLIYAQQFGSVFPQRWNFISQTEQSVPLQNNTADCGVFALIYAYYTCIKKTLNFNYSHIGYFRRKICFELLNKHCLGAIMPEVMNVMCALEPISLSFAELCLKKYNDNIKQTILDLFTAPYCCESLTVVNIIMQKAAKMINLREEDVIILAWGFGLLKPLSSINVILNYVEESLPLEMLTKDDRRLAESLVDTYGKAAIIIIAWKWSLLAFEESRLPGGLPKSLNFLIEWQNPTSPVNPKVHGQILLVEEISRYSISYLACLKILLTLM